MKAAVDKTHRTDPVNKAEYLWATWRHVRECGQCREAIWGDNYYRYAPVLLCTQGQIFCEELDRKGWILAEAPSTEPKPTHVTG